MYSCYWSRPFKDSVQAFVRQPQVGAALLEAVGRLGDDPFDDPMLQTHQVKRAVGETFTSRVGGGGHRLIWRRMGDTIVLLLFGEHDAVYRRAERLRVEVDPGTHQPLVVDVDPTTDQPTPYRERRASEGSLFMAWNDRELADEGFEPQEVAVLRRLDTEAELADLGDRMSQATFERAYNLIAHGNAEPAVAPDDQAPYVSVVPDPVPAADEELERLVRAPAARGEFAPIEVDALADVLGRPIEDWMIFLHPDQARLAERPFSGPARIRGGAGTGKTVVALHRARHLAQRQAGRILFTTFVNNLPPVFAQLFRRLSPQLTDRVEFVNLHKWAFGYLRQQGAAPRVETQAIAAAFNSAWSAVATRSIVDAALQLARAPQGPAGAQAEPDPVECLRDGDPVRVRVFDSADDHDEALALALEQSAALPGVDAGDLAVLVPTNKLAEEYERRIGGLGLRIQGLARYDGTHVPAVKVGTYQRAKGLEFKQVFLPRLEASALGERSRNGEDEETYRERVALLRRQLFVAVTRARDDAWLGAVKAPGNVVSALPAT